MRSWDLIKALEDEVVHVEISEPQSFIYSFEANTSIAVAEPKLVLSNVNCVMNTYSQDWAESVTAQKLKKGRVSSQALGFERILAFIEGGRCESRLAG